jgi:hypothetical protein
MSKRDALNSKESYKVWDRELEGLGNPISRPSTHNFGAPTESRLFA